MDACRNRQVQAACEAGKGRPAHLVASAGLIGFAMSREGGNPAMAASSSGRVVLRLRELLLRYRGNFIAFKGIYLLSQAACGAGFLPLRKRDTRHKSLESGHKGRSTRDNIGYRGWWIS
jgi:hypothetical protein